MAVELTIPSITDIGLFLIQIIFAMILWQGYQLVKAKVEYEKIKTEKAKITLEISKPKKPQDLNNIENPSTTTESIENNLNPINVVKGLYAKTKKKSL